MATSQLTVHTTEIDITQLPTKSVTFAPTRATVTREIEGIQTQLGSNEVTIVGLDPNIDPDSVRVEGYGLATITDIQAEVVPRTQQFQDQYPDLEDDDDDDSEDKLPALSDNDYGVDKTAVEDARQELQSAEAALASFQNSQNTAGKIVEFLDLYGQSIKAQEVDVAKMDDFLSVYRTRRTAESETHQQACAEITLWREKVENAKKKLTRAETAFGKAKDKASRAARREQEKKARKRLQERLQKQRIVQQRRKFWTPEISQVVVHLDRASSNTPGSSRRNSVVSNSENGVDYAPSKPLEKDSINLRLTYVVPSAKWAPRYELKLSTPKSSAVLIFGAQFENRTSESWKNANISFSTSQTFFSGLDDKIPTLDPWHVKLGSGFGVGLHNGLSASSLQSRTEVMANTQAKTTDLCKRQQFNRTMQVGAASASLFSRKTAAPNQGGIPLPPPARMSPPAMSAQAHAHAQPQQTPYRRDATDSESDSEDDSVEVDGLTLSPEAHSIAHQDSIRQDYGLTTIYDLPGQRTLEPSTVKRRHVIAELHLPSIALSYVLIPKLRRAAFLKARITNTTSVSLLRGKAGMTIDGAFLGSTTLPNCEPGHFIDLSLGVDPSILVTYAKPTARRSTTGFFNKESYATFTRSCWIKNTKKHDVSITVLDQIPVSEDENLRITILEPKGLEKENRTLKLHELFKNGEKGTGEVVLGKDGQVRWNLKLRPGKDVKLVLEYESRIPSGQQIVELY